MKDLQGNLKMKKQDILHIWKTQFVKKAQQTIQTRRKFSALI